MPGRVQIDRTTTVNLYGAFTVGDLLAALDGLPSSARVSIKHHDATDQRDSSSTTITVHGVGA
jgi:hypothetical protein